MLNPESYCIASKILLHLLGVIYLFSFASFLFQMKGLYGEQGILPVQSYLRLFRNSYGRKSYYYCPSLFWINAGDTMLVAMPLLGIILSIFLILGIQSALTLFLLFIVYLSIVSIGQDFLSFIWDVFLLEITLNAIFLAMTPVPNLFIWISLNLLLFRFHIEVGAVKLQSNDKNWWNLSALSYHYETQPLPNTQAWYAHQLPECIHKFNCAAMFIIELIVPFGIFGSESIRFWTFVLLAGLQFIIWLTGNFAFLNHLTTLLCVILLSDYYFSSWTQVQEVPPADPYLSIGLSFIGILLITMQLIQFWNHFFPNRTFANILYKIGHFHMFNRYGLFAVMTIDRYEITVEGSQDCEDWKEYLFFWKPCELNQRPKRISPLHPRLDWQCWFLPFQGFQKNTWFQNFMIRILQGSKTVLGLVRKNPFPDHPPKYLRAVAKKYEFTNRDEKNKTGNWWKVTDERPYSPILERNE